MKKLFWWVIAILVVILIIVSATKKNDEGTMVKSEDTSPIKIGYIGPLTGEVPALGQASRAAVELATEEINAAGGVNGRMLEVTYEDGKCGAAAASAAAKLLNVDQVKVIIGGLCSGETASFVKTAMEKKVPTIAYCSSAPALTGSGPYFFRNYPSDVFSAKFDAEYLYNTLGSRKVAMLYHISEWGSALQQTFNTEFTKLGGTVVASEGAQQNSKDFRSQLAKIKASDADYVYMILYSDGGAIAVNQSKELGLNKKILFPETGDDPNFIKSVSGKADILYSLARSPNNATFATNLMAKTKGTEVPVCAPQAYDALKIAAQVMAKVGTDPDAFAAEMHNVTYDGVSGKNQFDQNGDLSVADFVVRRIENGKATEVK